MSVLNGQLASYVDSEVIRKQVDIISGASSEGAVSTTLTSSAASRTGSSISSAPDSPEVSTPPSNEIRDQYYKPVLLSLEVFKVKEAVRVVRCMQNARSVR